MLNTVGTWFISILVVLNIGYIVVGNIIRLGYWIKCIEKKKTCNNRECLYRYYCEKYKESYTQDEIDSLVELIESYKHKVDV